jgi:RimJ/RimL family protein N-acetyltransferase
MRSETVAVGSSPVVVGCARGQGYATEVARACLVAGLEQLAAPRIIAVVDAENEASLRVPGRIGMKKIETIHAHERPHVLFASSRS